MRRCDGSAERLCNDFGSYVLYYCCSVGYLMCWKNRYTQNIYMSFRVRLALIHPLASPVILGSYHTEWKCLHVFIYVFVPECKLHLTSISESERAYVPGQIDTSLGGNKRTVQTWIWRTSGPYIYGRSGIDLFFRSSVSYRTRFPISHHYLQRFATGRSDRSDGRDRSDWSNGSDRSDRSQGSHRLRVDKIDGTDQIYW